MFDLDKELFKIPHSVLEILIANIYIKYDYSYNYSIPAIVRDTGFNQQTHEIIAFLNKFSSFSCVSKDVITIPNPLILERLV